MDLEPSLWETLPNELLHLVFSRLPVAGIGRLRILSKEWKKNVDCKDSEFNHVFDATAHLNMFTLLNWVYFGVESFFGNIYDVQADKWHVYKTNIIFKNFENFDGADGGLVCCISKKKWCNIKPVFVIVMNPFTKQKMQLPPLLCRGAEKTNTKVEMVKLTVDRKTKEYKVFVVGSIEHGGHGFFAEVYDSHTKEWTVVEATQGHIIVWHYLDYNPLFPRSLCVYNCADGILQRFNEIDIVPGLKLEPDCCVLIEDHLFVLHKEALPGPANLLEVGESMLEKYCISEFHLPEKAIAWVKVEVHSCGPCKCFLDTPHGIITSKLWGCNGFLLVCGDGSEGAWLYNLSTCKWRNLPTFEKPFSLDMMCEISWSVVV